MPDEYRDPSGNTDQFRAYVRSAPSEPSRSRMPLYIGLAAAAVLVVIVVFLAVS